MVTWEIIGGIAAIVTIVGGIFGAIRVGKRLFRSKRIPPIALSKVDDHYTASLFPDNSDVPMQGLSPEEIDLLHAAIDHGGVINIIEYDQVGKFVQVAGRDFLEVKKPEYRISYLEALESLLDRKFVRKETERWFCLTKSGSDYISRFSTTR